MADQQPETFEDFRKSFNYGSRTDLLFKWMDGGSTSDEEAANFFQQLLVRLGDAHDTGNFDEVIRHLYESQVYGYDPGDRPNQGFEYDNAPWTPVAKPLSESKLALISAGGLFVTGNDPLGRTLRTRRKPSRASESSCEVPPWWRQFRSTRHATGSPSDTLGTTSAERCATETSCSQSTA